MENASPKAFLTINRISQKHGICQSIMTKSDTCKHLKFQDFDNASARQPL